METFDEILAVISAASAGDTGARVATSDSARADDRNRRLLPSQR